MNRTELREKLNKIDCENCNKYDLVNLFESVKLSNEDLNKLSEMVEDKDIHDFLYERCYIAEEDEFDEKVEKLLEEENTAKIEIRKEYSWYNVYINNTMILKHISKEDVDDIIDVLEKNNHPYIYKETESSRWTDGRRKAKETVEESMSSAVDRQTNGYKKTKGQIQCNGGAQAKEVEDLLKAKYDNVTTQKGKGGKVIIKFSKNESLGEDFDEDAFEKLPHIMYGYKDEETPNTYILRTRAFTTPRQVYGAYSDIESALRKMFGGSIKSINHYGTDYDQHSNRRAFRVRVIFKEDPFSKNESLGEDFYDDEYDDFELASIYGGDFTYCPVCGATMEYDEDGDHYCPKCKKSGHTLSLIRRGFIKDDNESLSEAYKLRVGYKDKETNRTYSREYPYNGETDKKSINWLKDADKIAFDNCAPNEDVLGYNLVEVGEDESLSESFDMNSIDFEDASNNKDAMGIIDGYKDESRYFALAINNKTHEVILHRNSYDLGWSIRHLLKSIRANLHYDEGSIDDWSFYKYTNEDIAPIAVDKTTFNYKGYTIEPGNNEWEITSPDGKKDYVPIDPADEDDGWGKTKEFVDGIVGESLSEDTVKQGSQWVNKGKEGTHGKFKTKKEADAQRRAIWVNWGK